ncbi:MAG: LptF/LptG family permease [Cytophagaceae bacterium]|nr:LptF/LptG family permease [Cytophagaceae bacterium]
MNILDRYIIKRFLVAFVYVVLIVVLILVVIDFTEKSDDFIKANVPFSQVFAEYYFNYIPYIANMFSPISIFIATVFVTARMATHTEIIAILSSGVSLRRILFPYFLGSAFVGIIIFFLIGWVIPNANKVRIAFENEHLIRNDDFHGSDLHLKIAPTTYGYLKSYNGTVNVGTQFTLETIEGKELKSKLKATKITWQPEKSKWLIEDYSIRFIDKGKEKIIRGISKDTAINFTPNDFATTYMLHETFTLPELNNYIEELKEKGAENIEMYLTEKYERYTYPLAIIILTMIGVICSARKSREGTGVQIAFGFLLAVIFILLVLISQSFSNVGSMGPLMASLLPNIIFTFIGLIMYKTVPK